MRALKASTLNKKLRPSKFFEHFLSANGPTCTAKASTADIQAKLKVLYLDLAFGNLQQNKYYQYFIGDPRIVQEAINDLQNKVLETLACRDALRFAANRPQDPDTRPILANPVFGAVIQKAELKYIAYSTILEGIVKYRDSGMGPDGFIHPEMCNPQFLVTISIQLNGNPFMKGAKNLIL
jgi:hypothetical protein